LGDGGIVDRTCNLRGLLRCGTGRYRSIIGGPSLGAGVGAIDRSVTGGIAGGLACICWRTATRRGLLGCSLGLTLAFNGAGHADGLTLAFNGTSQIHTAARRGLRIHDRPAGIACAGRKFAELIDHPPFVQTGDEITAAERVVGVRETGINGWARLRADCAGDVGGAWIAPGAGAGEAPAGPQPQE